MASSKHSSGLHVVTLATLQQNALQFVRCEHMNHNSLYRLKMNVAK